MLSHSSVYFYSHSARPCCGTEFRSAAQTPSETENNTQTNAHVIPMSACALGVWELRLEEISLF